MLAHGVGERVSRRDIVAHLPQDLPEPLVSRCAGDGAQGPEHRHARLEQIRKLSVRHRDVARADAAPPRNRRRVCLEFHLNGKQLPLIQRAHDGRLVVGLHEAGHFLPGARLGYVLVGGHLRTW